jgi:antitoxin component YwqK of YwqJK toxin-antitoxin module
MTQQWYYTSDGQTNVGPVSTAELKRLARTGKLAPTDMVQMAGMSKWVPAVKVKGLFDVTTAPAGTGQEQPRPEPTPPITTEPSAPRSATTGDRRPATGHMEKVVHLKDAVIRLKDRGVVFWNGLSRKAKLGVAAGSAVAIMFVLCAGIASILSSGRSNPKFSDADYAVDFSNTDYSVRPVDYTKGPQGQPVEEREGVFPDNDVMAMKSPDEVGKVFKEAGFTDGTGGFKRHGVRTLWYPVYAGAKKGEKKFAEEHWYDGKLHGPLASFDKTGQKRLERTYQDGQPHGKETIWDEGGRVKAECYYASGKKHGVYKEYFSNGKVSQEGAYKDGEQHGKWTLSHEDGSRSAEEYYVAGKKHGQFTGWHPNGQKRLEVSFVNGKKVGRHTEWHPNGQKAKEFDSKDGLAQGAYTEWHPNGQKANEGKYKDGKEEGEWNQWYEDGAKRLRAQFSAGKINGGETAWYSTGLGGNEEYVRAYQDGLKLHEVRFYAATIPDPVLSAKAQKAVPVGPGRKMYDYSWSRVPGQPTLTTMSGVWTEWDVDGTVKSIKRH